MPFIIGMPLHYYSIIGEDFYVTVPTPSMLHLSEDNTNGKGTVLEGTRITLVKTRYGTYIHTYIIRTIYLENNIRHRSNSSLDPSENWETPGFEFTIRTPGKPLR